MKRKKDIIKSWEAYSTFIKNRYKSLAIKKGFGTPFKVDLIITALKEYIRKNYNEEVDIDLNMSAEEIYNKLFKYLCLEYYRNVNFIKTFWRYVAKLLLYAGGNPLEYLNRFLEERYKCSEY